MQDLTYEFRRKYDYAKVTADTDHFPVQPPDWGEWVHTTGY
jgi:hypothetical protein